MLPAAVSQGEAQARAKQGRSAPRSRLGCTNCKARHVRCDEVKPGCSGCRRLQLDCVYQPRRQHVGLYIRPGKPASKAQPPRPQVSSFNSPAPLPPIFNGNIDDFVASLPLEDFTNDFNTSWAGEFCLFPESAVTPPGAAPSTIPIVGPVVKPVDVHDAAGSLPDASAAVLDGHAKCPAELPSIDAVALERDDLGDDRFLDLFQQIEQPPAAILIGGVERWRRLRQYLSGLCEHSRAVSAALLCLISILAAEDADVNVARAVADARVLRRHNEACTAIRSKLAKSGGLRPKAVESLLAAIFLLGVSPISIGLRSYPNCWQWFEVVRDQDSKPSLFPRDLADDVIMCEMTWSRYSQQILCWLNTLDSKAMHLGGEHLLSPQALEVVARFPIQITSGLDPDSNEALESSRRERSASFLSQASPGSAVSASIRDLTTMANPSTGTVKQTVLNAVIQPALQWYMVTQSYCRQISSHDKHHRKRFTADDEFEVITACKQLETALLELWEQRPAVISLDAQDLSRIISPDVAHRLEEVFSVYLGSFWILFVHLHRVSWWTLPHSPLARRSLEEVWRHLQRAYGEEIQGRLRKIVHPALLWPLFLFGSECSNAAQEDWSIDQLEALGAAKSDAVSDVTDAEGLPPFKLSSGATRNAKRAAMLLRQLVKEQRERQCRVDDRDLSLKMFGCYFSIV